ncbi:hypothetical protein MLD38_039076 [Melastoma candidum]|nr:hypothetical protein MLD38_039076 [Melastoma candidum]
MAWVWGPVEDRCTVKGRGALNAQRESEKMAKRGSRGKGKAKQATTSKKKAAGRNAGNVGESSTNLNPGTSMGLGTEQNPIVFDEDGVWVNPNPSGGEEEVDPEHLRIYEELLKQWMRNPPKESADWSEAPSDYETEPSEDEFDPEEFARLREKQKGKQPRVDEDTTDEETTEDGGSKPSADANSKVTDSDAICSLFRDGTYIAHKEAGLLLGVVDRIGERVKLEWTESYASVWIRRVGNWICYAKPGWQDEGTSSSSTEVPSSVALVRSSDSIGKRVREWAYVEWEEGKKKRRLERRRTRWRFKQMRDVGVQTEGLGAVVQTKEKDGREMNYVDVLVEGSLGSVRGSGNEQQLDEEAIEWSLGAWYCGGGEPIDLALLQRLGRDKQEKEAARISLEQNRQQKNMRRQMNYADMAQTFLADLSKEENQIAKLLACRALRLIVGRMEGPIQEINEVLTDLTLFARYNGNCEEFVRKGQGWWEKNEWDRHNAAAMERFKTQVEREAKLNRLSERVDILLLRIDSSRKGLSVQEKAELGKCFKMWKVAANLKIQELHFQIQGWQRKLAKMEALASERMRPSYVNTDLRFVLQGSQGQADSTNQEEDIGTTTQDAGPLTFGDALELITSAIVDNSRRPRPPALTLPVIRRLMARLNQIDVEQSPMQRLKECRELRQLLGQLQGVPNYIGDLHEELYTLALLDAPDASWQPDPVVPASPTSGSSTEGELWLDERDDYPPSSPDQEPSWSDA